jgi:hypothetical protein
LVDDTPEVMLCAVYFDEHFIKVIGITKTTMVSP